MEKTRLRFEEEKEKVGHTWNSSDSKAQESISVALYIKLTPLGLIQVEKSTAGWEEALIEEEVIGTTTTSTTSSTSTETTEAEKESSSTEEGTSKAAKQLPVQTAFKESVNKRTKSLTLTSLEPASSSSELTDAERQALRQPLPLSARQVRDSRGALKAFIKADREVESLNEIRNQ